MRSLHHKPFAIALLLASCAVAQQKTIVCSSQNGASRACPADTFYGVLLMRETSSGVCVQGKTWRYDTGAIHVSKGCSAEFLVRPRRTDPRSNDGYVIHGTGEDAFHTNGPVRPAPAPQDSDSADGAARDDVKTPVRKPQ